MENVAMFDSPGKGRGLKATKEFWAGDVIFSEPSLAAVVFDRYGNDVIRGSECFDAEICAAILQNSLLSSSSYVVFPSLNRLEVVLRIFWSVTGRDTLIIDTMRLAGLVWGLFEFGCLPSTLLWEHTNHSDQALVIVSQLSLLQVNDLKKKCWEILEIRKSVEYKVK